MIRAVVGAGGKTGWIKRKAEEYRQQGKKVFVTTSTHMFVEEHTLVSDDVVEILSRLEESHFVMAGIREGEKIRALSRDTYEQVCLYAEEVLIEADGSRHMPLKFPAEHEPVIYENVDEIVVVCGLHGLGKKASEAVQRLELAEKQLGLAGETVIGAEQVQALIRKGYMEPLKMRFPEKNIVIEANHDGSLYQRALAGLLKAQMEVSMIKESWFLPQPKLVICGGGHVALDLAKMASCLDFYVKVVDDREEFANKERFCMADEVVCDSFLNLEQHLEPDAYYVVVTRGHQDDFQCVRTILAHSYRYLGMIGSKLKVKKTFENLRREGISEKQIRSICAPIGLDIKAVTPAEIAVSILAQVILEKNSSHQAFASRELLDSAEKGVLCIIIEKSGSSPRGVGSMMLVTENGTIDSIGGGVVEYAAIQDARNCREPMIREYQLNNEESRSLGMICGGSNRVLFIPV